MVKGTYTQPLNLKARRFLLACTSLLLHMLSALQAQAAQEIEIPLSDGADAYITRHAAEGDDLIVWFPSEFGISPRQGGVAEALAARGIETWLPDLHATWFLPVGRYSLTKIDPAFLKEILQAARTESGKRIYLMAPGRTAALGLSAIRQWQVEGMQEHAFGGAILLHPKLYASTPQGGEAAEFIPVASATNVPVYLIQPRNSAYYWRSKDIRNKLEEGGASVYLHTLDAVGDGFYARPDYSEEEGRMTRKLPALLERALVLLSETAEVPLTAAVMSGQPDSAMPVERNTSSAALLKPYKGDRETPPLSLETLEGERIELRSYRGKVVVLNFWATWCPPCVEEIPSLERLRKLRHDRGLEVLSVDVGEEPEKVRAFLEDKPVGYPVALDPEARAFKAWNTYAFPTTFILDREHRIRYAVFGAFAWDAQEVLDAVDALLAEQPGV
jgi:peroxiredoxin/dienelactone hydrolase